MVWSCAFQGSPKASWKRCKKTQESVNQQAHTPKKLSTKAGSHNYTGSGVKAMHDADKETVNIQNPFGELQWLKKI